MQSLRDAFPPLQILLICTIIYWKPYRELPFAEKGARPMEALPSLITDLTILLAIAAVTTLLCKKINLPSVLG